MSDTILGGDFTVYYESDNRQKRLEWTGTATGTRTCNEAYSALQDLFDELNQMDDGTPMSAQTPTEYTIGIIDAGDDDPWFIDKTTAEHLTGGALRSASWTRATASNTGVVRLPYTVGGGTDFITSDIGLTVTDGVGGDSGTLLDFTSDGVTGTAWIRPADSTAANDWDTVGSPTGSISVSGGTGANLAQDAAASTGESLWANIFSIGTIADNSHLYVNQNGTLLTAYKATTDWWSDGQIDILVNVKEVDIEVDEAVVQVFGRRYTASYDNFEVDLSAGGRNPIPLATGTDLNSANGYRQMIVVDASNDFTVGEIIQDDIDSNVQGVVTSNTGTAPNLTIQYYLIGDPLTDFDASGSPSTQFTGQDSTSTATPGEPTDVNAAALTGTGIVHAANETFDIDEDGTTENYSIVIDCSEEALTDVYPWSQYVLRRGGETTTDTDGIQGQFYIGSDFKIAYTVLNGTINEGDVVVQRVSLATGTVVAHNTTDNFLILRNSRGTFDSTNIVDVPAGGSPTPNITGPTSTVITPIKAAPFGTFAGGTWFCAPGVVLDNVPGADANNYQLTDDDGNIVTAPTKVTTTVGNTRASDRLSQFRLTGSGGTINKAEYLATAQPPGSITFVMGSNITADTPPNGSVRFVDVTTETEYRMRYSSFATATFTLTSTIGLVAEGGTNTTTIVDNAGSPSGSFNTNAKVGDLIRNITAGGIGYVVSVDSDIQITTTTIAGQTTGDEYEINTLPVTTTTSDTVYVPFLDLEEDTGTDVSPGSEVATITFLAPVFVRSRVRQAGVILPFEADGEITSSGLVTTTIRTPDTIFT